MQPRLQLTPDEIRCSPPTLDGDHPSWFVRIRVTNYGLRVARGCTGRLLEVWTSSGIRVDKFDPLTLYWARQDPQTGHKSIEIQGQGDVEFLDVLQVKEDPRPLILLRVHIPEPMTLSRGAEDSPSPGTDPILVSGGYYLRLGVFSENANPKLMWIELACAETSPRDCHDTSPCSYRFARPSFYNLTKK